jgi:membrane protein implicated in regulation of membrane protease activity
MRAMTPYDFPHTSASTPEERQLAQRHLHVEQVRLLYRFSLVGYLASLMVAFILGAILWNDLDKPALFAWFAAISLVTIGRYALYKVFTNANPPSERLGAWERRFLAGSVIAALCWAVLGTALLPADNLANRMAVVMLVALLVTGAVAYYSPHAYAFKITAFVTLVPLAVTSTRGWLRRLGARWQQLHRLVYPAAIAGCVHFWWQVKADWREPLVYAAVLAGLLAWRWRRARMRRSVPAAATARP